MEDKILETIYNLIKTEKVRSDDTFFFIEDISIGKNSNYIFYKGQKIGEAPAHMMSELKRLTSTDIYQAQEDFLRKYGK